MSAVLVRYERAGGRPPSDEETLEVREDGTFSARRTVGGSRIGRFAGELPAATRQALERDVEAVADEEDAWTETPRDGATETIEAGRRTAEIGTPRGLDGPWAALAERLRELLDRVTGDPVAAVELEASARAGALVAAGSEPVALDPTSVGVRLVRLGADGALLGQWTAPAAETASGTPSRLQPGDRIPLAFDHPLELARGDQLQVWVTLRVADDDGERDARLFTSVIEGSDR